MKNDLIYRIRALLRREAMERDLDDELQFHLERETAKYIDRGLPPGEALKRARIELGGLDQVRDACRSARGISALESLIQDLRYGLRGMRRAPAFTLTALLTLGLTTAAMATVFTIAHTLLFRRMPVDRPDEVVFVQATRLHGTRRAWVSYPDYLSFRNGSRTIGHLAAHYSNAPLLVTSDRTSKQINGAIVSGNFFSTLGLRPALGRFFTEEEDSVPDRDPVAVVSSEFWRTWFGSSPYVIGATIKVNGTAFNIVGVAPSSFPGVTYQPARSTFRR
jgi:hypothetical protein